MILGENLSIYFKYKKITLFNLLATFIISIFSFDFVISLTKKDSHIFFIEYNTQTNSISDNIDQLDMSNLRDELDTRLQSFTNFTKWKNFFYEDGIDYSYNNFISLRLADDKLVIANNNTDFISEELVELLFEYIDYTISIINFNLTTLIIDKIENEKYDKKCNGISNFLKANKEYNLYSLDRTDQLLKSLEKCIELQSKVSKDIYYDIYFHYEKELLKPEDDRTELRNFIYIGNVVFEKVSINNLKAINIFSYTIILLVFTLIIQNVLLTLLQEKNKN